MLNMTTDAVEIRHRNTFSIGMMIGLSSWALIFFTLLWGYVVFRMRTDSWIGAALTQHAVVAAVLNTVVITLSSWCLSLAFKDNVRRPEMWIRNAFAFGACFLLGQFYLWQVMLREGLHWQTSTAGSMFFLLTGFHALHILGALLAVLLLGLRFKSWRGTLTAKGIKYFWDFLLGVWMIMFVLIFIVQ